MSFIPLISSQENIYTTESSLKYFLIQAVMGWYELDWSGSRWGQVEGLL
jgi:hypothetical protein